MTDFLNPQNDFLRKVISIIEENLADEDFSVIHLSEGMNMSRSNLLRKVKKQTGVSVSVYIRQVRLHHAKELLRSGGLNVSEISYKVGFSSTSYFTKCFREQFGYTPGEEGKRVEEQAKPTMTIQPRSGSKFILIGLSILIPIVVFFLFKNRRTEENIYDYPEKSIAVLPFKNDSNDSSNLYIVNGLMEAILDNLQKIEDLEVTSRTTTEKYRGGSKTIPELFKELEVNYFVEGSGQKIGDQILLTIQLIDGRTDKHLWSEQYQREAKDIFKLQMEVSKNIAGKIEAIITPEEQRLIEKIPTKNLVAYDYFLKGSNLLTMAETKTTILEAIGYFKKAIAEDSQFAQPYAYTAISYYYLDVFQVNKQYGIEINTFSDKALLFDSELAVSLMAKGLFYMQDKQYDLAVDYFKKGLQYSPGAGRIHNLLSEIYLYFRPNTQKYLIHALQGVRTAISDKDSSETSNIYLNLSSALAQNGFVLEAEKYAQKSLDYNPANLFSQYLNIYLQLAQNFDLERTKNGLIDVLEKDTSRLDLVQEVAKVNYTQRNYEEAWVYYKKFIGMKKMWGLDIYNDQDINIAFVLDNIGKKEEAKDYYEAFLQYAENDQTIYKDLYFCSYYAAKGDVENGMNHLKAFTKQKDYQYWIVLFLDKDPVILQLSGHPHFSKTINQIKENFWMGHKETRKLLEKEGVI